MKDKAPVKQSIPKRLLSAFLSAAMVLCYLVVAPVQEARAESAGVAAVSLGRYHSAAVTSDGSLWTWGSSGLATQNWTAPRGTALPL